MLARGKDAETLLALVAETLRAEIMPGLPADKRYTAAMMANALDIAARAIAVEEEAPALALLDTFYDDGDGTLAGLAKDIRAGKVSEKTHKDLRERLKAHLLAELAVRNPRHAVQRERKS
jgi:hypothetical protein